MPPVQRGHVRRLPSGKVQLRYYDEEGKHRTAGVFPSKSAAYAHYRDVIEPRLRGDLGSRRQNSRSPSSSTFMSSGTRRSGRRGRPGRCGSGCAGRSTPTATRG